MRSAFSCWCRSARGVELTAAGRAFLDHARLALVQVEAAVEAARRAAQPAKTVFRPRLPDRTRDGLASEAMRILRDELPNIEVTISSQYSPDLAEALAAGQARLGFHARRSADARSGIKVVIKEPLVVALPSDHRLASRKAIALRGHRG